MIKNIKVIKKVFFIQKDYRETTLFIKKYLHGDLKNKTTNRHEFYK